MRFPTTNTGWMGTGTVFPWNEEDKICVCESGKELHRQEE